MIQLIASDIDGTLMLDGQYSIPSTLFPIIRALRENGIYFAACSGRQYHNIRNLFAPVADEIGYICENGSLVVWQGKILSAEVIDRAAGQTLMREILAQPECEVLLSGVHTCYIQPKDPTYVTHMREQVGNDTTVVSDVCAVEEPFLKISLYRENGVDEALAEKFVSSAPYLVPAVGRSSWMDFLRTGCGKGTALDVLCQHLQIDNSRCMAFGDNENDLPMIGHAGTVCAMADGNPRFISYADRTVSTVEEELLKLLKSQ